MNFKLDWPWERGRASERASEVVSERVENSYVCFIDDFWRKSDWFMALMKWNCTFLMEKYHITHSTFYGQDVTAIVMRIDTNYVSCTHNTLTRCLTHSLPHSCIVRIVFTIDSVIYCTYHTHTLTHIHVDWVLLLLICWFPRCFPSWL